ncbi:polyketide cyclase, partial [Streptomyces sp. NPDC058964]
THVLLNFFGERFGVVNIASGGAIAAARKDAGNFGARIKAAAEAAIAPR